MLDRIERIIKLLVLLQSGVPYNSEQLSHEFTVSRRTIFRDIAALKNAGIPVEYDEQSCTYWVLPKRVLNSLSDININELASLYIATGLSSLQANETFTSRLKKILSELSIRFLSVSKRLELTRLLHSIKIDHENQSDSSPPTMIIDTVMTAIRESCKIRLKSLTGDPFFFLPRFTFAPYELIVSSQSWRAVGQTFPDLTPREIDLTLISKVELTEEHFLRPSDKSWRSLT